MAESSKGCIGGCSGLLALVLVGSLFVFGSCGSGDTKSPNKYGAFDRCETAIKSQLKAPSTAKFSNKNYFEGSATHTVYMDVDAQNSFGASMRNRFTCELSFSESSGTWSLQDIRVN
ncbi:hypothetical protein [Glutamicibacter protophormiae]|uniref:hypothetical protein n=1 Tax=Glutamicibacter protophormiae TaxID=37930 RepID=UPI00195838E1|nr:hypothetical protein [Glutamicibacter protophormiae]QRQ79815.1 hypothetical protein JQN66_06280 [Glutamicibacter protophormiae]